MKNRARRLFTVLVFLSAMLASVAVPAHHSFAMFDFEKVVTISGTVKEFQWTNPHVILWVDAEGKPGEAPAVWSLEMTSPGNLTRGGWDRKVVSAGDRVSVELNPLRNGGHGGALIKLNNLSTGKSFDTNLRDVEKPGLK